MEGQDVDWISLYWLGYCLTMLQHRSAKVRGGGGHVWVPLARAVWILVLGFGSRFVMLKPSRTVLMVVVPALLLVVEPLPVQPFQSTRVC